VPIQLSLPSLPRPATWAVVQGRPLTPEEDAIGDPDDETDDDVDPTLPADLWFLGAATRTRRRLLYRR